MTLLNDVRIGSQVPTTEHLPDGKPSATLDEVVELAEMAGLFLDDWQVRILDGALMERHDNPTRWAAFEVGVLVQRQAGKGSILEARQLAGLFLLDERLQLHSAHEFKTCYEHFRRVVDLVERCDDLRAQVKIVRTGAGDQAIELKNGNRIRFVARSRSSGRGFSADTVYLDEAFQLSDSTIGALLPAMSARPNPQIWYSSSAPHEDSAVLHRLRRRGHAGDDPRLYFAEWGNEPDVDPLDVDAWYRANPGLGIRIDIETVATEQRSMSPGEFARERLGIPDPEPDERGGTSIPLDRWDALTDGDSLPVDASVRLALDVPPDRSSAVFCIAGKRDDNLVHVSVRRFLPPHDMKRLVEFAKTLTDGHGTPLILPPNSPARAWRTELIAAGVELDELTPAEYAEACGNVQAAVLEGRLRHRGQPEMNTAVAGLAARSTGDVETWSRRSSSSNISPFVAATCALVRVAEKVPEVSEPWVVFA